MNKTYLLLVFCLAAIVPTQAQQRYWTVYDLWKNDGEVAYFDKNYKQCVVAYDTLITKYKGKYQQDAFFNRMTCMALSGDTARAMQQFKLMVDKGYHDLYYLRNNKELLNLTKHPNWNALNVRAETNLDIWEKRNGGKLNLVRREIMNMYEEELRYQQLSYYQSNYPNSGIKETTAQLAEQQKAVQKKQFERLIEMIKENGGAVFGRSKIGRAASQVVVLIVMKADYDPATQEAFVTAMENSEAGEYLEGDLALLIDKVLVRKGLPQRYATTIILNGYTNEPDTPVVVEDPANLNARRKKIGLDPLNESWYKH